MYFIPMVYKILHTLFSFTGGTVIIFSVRLSGDVGVELPDVVAAGLSGGEKSVPNC